MADVRCYIGLGSNLDDPRGHVEAAFGALGALPETRLAARSALYSSPPMGPPNQPDYVNAVAAVDTRLEPLALLEALQAVESAHGRRRDGERWGPRTLDLDLLLYGNAVIRGERLTVPHPGIRERLFVLRPLADLAPELRVPGGAKVQEWLSSCPDQGLSRLE